MRLLRNTLATFTALCVSLSVSAATWSPLSNEGQMFTLTSSATVRFGAGSNWSSATLLPGYYPCGVGTFGDPILGVVKTCQVQTDAASTTPTTPTSGSTTTTDTTPGAVTAPAPACYPWDGAAQATKVTTQPDGNLQWMMANADQASWIVTWYCADPGGALPQSISGYRKDIAPFQVLDTLRQGTKDERDAAWAASASCTPSMDQSTPSCTRYAQLKALIQQQLRDTCPAGCLTKP